MYYTFYNHDMKCTFSYVPYIIIMFDHRMCLSLPFIYLLMMVCNHGLNWHVIIKNLPLVIVSWRFCVCKVPNKEERGKNATLIHLSTALRDHAHSFSPLVCVAECHWDSIAFITASSSPPLVSGTCISAACVSFSFCRWKTNNNFTRRAW